MANFQNDYLTSLFRSKNKRDAKEGDIFNDGGQTFSFINGMWSNVKDVATGKTQPSLEGIVSGVQSGAQSFVDATWKGGTTPATPETPSEQEGKPYGAYGEFNLQRYLIDSGLQNIFNLYEQNIAHLNAQQKKQLEEQAYIREMSKKYLGEYGASSGASSMSTEAGLVDIYSQYMQNKTAIEQHHDELSFGLQQTYEQQKAGLEAQRQAVDIQEKEVQLDDAAQKAMIELAGKTYGGFDNKEDYLASIKDTLRPADYLTLLEQDKLDTASSFDKKDDFGNLYYADGLTLYGDDVVNVEALDAFEFDKKSGVNKDGASFVNEQGFLMVQSKDKEKNKDIVEWLKNKYRETYDTDIFQTNSVVQYENGKHYVYRNGNWYELKNTNYNINKLREYDSDKFIAEGDYKNIKTFEAYIDTSKQTGASGGTYAVEINGTKFSFSGNEASANIKETVTSALLQKYGHIDKMPKTTVIVLGGVPYICIKRSGALYVVKGTAKL